MNTKAHTKSITKNNKILDGITTKPDIVVINEDVSFQSWLRTTKGISDLIINQKLLGTKEFAKIGDDGSSLFIKIPVKIRRRFPIKKGQYFKFYTESPTTDVRKLIISIEDSDNGTDKIPRLKSGIDEKILKKMITHQPNKWFTTNEVCGLIGYSWKTVFQHLTGLATQGLILRSEPTNDTREYTRNKEKIFSERQIKWKLIPIKE